MHDILRMDSFHEVIADMVVLYLHRCPLYEQLQVFLPYLLIQLYKLHIGHLLLGSLENPYTGIQYGTDQLLLHHYYGHQLDLLVFRCLQLIQNACRQL